MGRNRRDAKITTRRADGKLFLPIKYLSANYFCRRQTVFADDETDGKSFLPFLLKTTQNPKNNYFFHIIWEMNIFRNSLSQKE